MTTKPVHIVWTEAYITSACNIRHPDYRVDLDHYTNYYSQDVHREWFENQGYHWCEKCESKLSPLQLLAATDL